MPLEAEDCFLLPGGGPFQLASDLALAPFDAEAAHPVGRRGGVVSFNDGGDFFLVGGHFPLAGSHASFLRGLLPPIVHVRGETDRAALCWCVVQMRHEMRE